VKTSDVYIIARDFNISAVFNRERIMKLASEQATGFTAEESGFDFCREEIFLFSIASRPALGPHPPSQLVRGGGAGKVAGA
jgi:hypothetical protein